MYDIRSGMLSRVMGNFRESSDDNDYRRYQVLDDMLRMASAVEAYEDKTIEDDTRRKEKEDKGFKGGEGVSSGVSRIFRDMLEEYLPGGYFRWEEYAKKLADNFYRMAYAQFHTMLPKMLSAKLKSYNIDRSDGSLEIDSEMLNKVITDSLIYLHENPDILKDGLINAYRRKEGEEDRGVGMAEAFFVPRVDKSTLAERLKQDSGSDVKEGDADEEVLDNLKDRSEVKWEWKSLDEYGVLHFTLPDLYGSREFMTKLPSEIQYIKPGEYTFNIKKVVDGRGAIVEFKEQHDSIQSSELSSLEENGLGEDQLRSFINNGIIARYYNHLRSLPAEKLVEEFLGTFSIGGDQITSVEDLDELSGYGSEGKEKSKGLKGKEKVHEKYEESVGREREKLQQVINRWLGAPGIAKQFMKVTEADGARIAKAVASKYPLKSEKSVPSIDSIMATQPVVEMVLRYIMSPHVPVSSGKSSPWMHFAWDAFQKMALKDPSVREAMERMVRYKRKDKEPGMPVSDGEISTILDSLTNVNISFKRLKDSIAETMQASKNDPALSNFFDRRKVFQDYKDKVLAELTEQYITDNQLSNENPEDQKKIEKFIQTKVNDLVSVMEGTKNFQALYRIPDESKKQQRKEKGAPKSVVEKHSSAMELLIHRTLHRLSSAV